jgi:Mg2+-importing ATPase
MSTLTDAAIGAALPFTPAATALGFTPLPASFFGILLLMVVGYALLAETGKHWFCASAAKAAARLAAVHPKHERRIHRRAARFSHRGPLARSRTDPASSTLRT